MPIGSQVIYNVGDLILSTVSSSGNTFLETKIAAATSSLILFDSTGTLTSQSLNTVTIGNSISSSYALTASYVSPSGNAFVQGGNSFGTTATLGTNDNNGLTIETSGSRRAFVTNNGKIIIGDSTTADSDLNLRDNKILSLGSSGGYHNIYLQKPLVVGSNYHRLHLGTRWYFDTTANVWTSSVQPNVDNPDWTAIDSMFTYLSFKVGSITGSTTSLTTSSYNDSERLRITTAATVLFNSGSDTEFRIVTNDSTNDPKLTFYSSSTALWAVGVDDSDDNKFKINQGSSLATSNVLTINTSNNVGIGTTSPAAKLDVSGSLNINDGNINIVRSNANPILSLRASSSNTYSPEIFLGEDIASGGSIAYSASGNYFSINTGTGGVGALNTRMVFPRDSANVGIGTTSPNYLLDLYDTDPSSAMMSLRSSGSGNAIIYLDAANGDLIGSDYCYMGQEDATLNFVINTGGNAGNIHLQPKSGTSNGILFVSGSTRFGLVSTHAHQFTGSVSLTDGLSAVNLTASNATINGNLTVTGSIFATLFSGSNIYITSSTLVVTDNILTLNALSPYKRYAGIEMYDSGSGNLSSFLWDGQGDYFFVTGSGVNSKIIVGPDQQTNLTSGRLTKATGTNIIGDSIVSDDGSGIIVSGYISGSSVITGNITASNISASGTGTFNNVGIGTSTLRNQLTVIGPAQNTSAISDSGNTGGTIFIGSSLNQVNQGGTLLFSTINDSGTYLPQWGVKTLFTNGKGNGVSDLSFSSRTTGSATALTEQVRFTSAGNVGISDTNPIAKLQVGGNISGSSFTSSIINGVGFLGTSSWATNSSTASFLPIGTYNITSSWSTNSLTASYLTPTNSYQITNLTASNISASGTIRAVSLIETSTIDAKYNIVPLVSQLDKVTKLNPVSFIYKYNNEPSIGLIAEEVGEIYPEFTTANKDAVAYSKMVSVLIQSVKELKSIVDIQQKQINELLKK